jgi:hypothetical protein
MVKTYVCPVLKQTTPNSRKRKYDDHNTNNSEMKPLPQKKLEVKEMYSSIKKFNMDNSSIKEKNKGIYHSTYFLIKTKSSNVLVLNSCKNHITFLFCVRLRLKTVGFVMCFPSVSLRMLYHYLRQTRSSDSIGCTTFETTEAAV